MIVHTACDTCGDHSFNDLGQPCAKHNNPTIDSRCSGTFQVDRTMHREEPS